MKRLLLTGALLVVLAAAAWFARRENGSSSRSPAVSSSPLTGAATSPRPTDIAPGATTLAALVREGLHDTSPGARDHALQVLLPRLTRLDPEAAAQLAQTWERGLVRDALLGRVAQEWARTDLAGALAWLTALPDPSDRSLAATATLALLAPDDPAGALELGRWLGEGTGDGRLEHTLQLWTEQHPAEAVAWIEAQPAGAWRDRLLGRVVHVRAQQDPASAAALAARTLPAGKAREDAYVNVARHWAVRDPAAASAWAQTLPPGLLQNRVHAEIERASRLR